MENKEKWLEFLERENKKLGLIRDKALANASLIVLLYIDNLVTKPTEWYVSLIYYDEVVPWMMLLTIMEDNARMICRGFLKLPSSYAYTRERCGEGRNLLPTLLSISLYEMSRRETVKTIAIPEPFAITRKILKEMEKDYSNVMELQRIADGAVIITLKDPDAFAAIWQTRKHCAEPIAGFCGGCAQVAYCSKVCQEENWPFHRHECLSKK
jgi:hypothetical protein